MANRVKCQVTGEWGTNDTFFRGKNGKYYKSQEIYLAYLAGKQNATKSKKSTKTRTREQQVAITDRVAELIDYKKGQPWPTSVNKCIRELDFYPDEIILSTFDQYKGSIQWAMKNKDFISDYQKVNYIFAIIKNNIGQVYRQWQAEQKRIKKAEERAAILSEDIELLGIPAPVVGNDVSGLLGDDLWT